MKTLFLLAFLVSNAYFNTASAQYNLYKKANNVHLLKQINDYRKTLGLPKVTYDHGLEEAARLQTLDNYTKKKFKNRGDDVNKLHHNSRFPLIRDRVSAVGVPTAGEFCAEICYAKAGMKNYPLQVAIQPYKSLEQLIFKRYQESDGHHAIITDPKFTRLGMHTIYDGRYVYNTIVFMTNRSELAYK